jgi:putative membrane protein
MDRRTALLAIAGVVPFAGSAVAQIGLAGPGEYRTTALMDGLFAIQTSQIALERSRNPNIRDFAQLEIAEQTGIAASLGTRPGGLPLRPDQAAIVQQLGSIPPGPQFDAMYVRGQIAGHDELLALNTAALQRGGGDPLILAVANVAVPSIQTHLQILQRLERMRGRA